MLNLSSKRNCWGQVEDEEAAHAVIGEALPHLGEEQNEQAARVFAQLNDHRDHRDGRDGDAGERDGIRQKTH